MKKNVFILTHLWAFSEIVCNYIGFPADGSAEFDVVYVAQGYDRVPAHLSQ